MAKARLNKKQRNWRDNFLRSYPYYRLREIWEDLDGDRILIFDGIESLPMPLIWNYQGEYPVWIHHNLQVKLRKYGDARYSATYSSKIVYGQLEKTTAQTSQIILPIQEAIAPRQPTNPVIVKSKAKKQRLPPPSIQLTLAVSGLEAELFQHRLQKRPHLPPVSSQEILGEKVSTWSMRDRREVMLPQVLVDMLTERSANDKEWQSAIDLFEIVGLNCAMEYTIGLPSIRKHFNQPEVSIIAQSQSVQATSNREQNSISVVVREGR